MLARMKDFCTDGAHPFGPICTVTADNWASEARRFHAELSVLSGRPTAHAFLSISLWGYQGHVDACTWTQCCLLTSPVLTTPCLRGQQWRTSYVDYAPRTMLLTRTTIVRPSFPQSLIVTILVLLANQRTTTLPNEWVVQGAACGSCAWCGSCVWNGSFTYRTRTCNCDRPLVGLFRRYKPCRPAEGAKWRWLICCLFLVFFFQSGPKLSWAPLFSSWHQRELLRSWSDCLILVSSDFRSSCRRELHTRILQCSMSYAAVQHSTACRVFFPSEVVEKRN